MIIIPTSRHLTLFIACLALCLAGQSVLLGAAGDKIISSRSSVLDDFTLDLSLQQWDTKGNFKMLGGPAATSNRWELTHPVDTNFLVWSAQFISTKDDAPFYMSYSLGQGAIKEDTVRDTDWDTNGMISDLSYSTSRGHNIIHDFKVGYRLTGPESLHPDNRPVIYFTLGYFYLKQSANYYDPTVTISSYNPVNISWSEKWEKYSLVYSGNEIGFKGFSKISKRLSLDMSFGYMPTLGASYNGLRYPQRPPGSERAEEIIATGDGLSYTILISYKPARNLSIQAGSQYLRLWTKGQDQKGTAWAGSWEKLSTNFKGLSWGVFYNF
ncbi:MAG: hypothetical protein WC980_05225 [Candidatus Brocadiia bacterium]